MQEKDKRGFVVHLVVSLWISEILDNKGCQLHIFTQVTAKINTWFMLLRAMNKDRGKWTIL